jgi:hypothetical protein
MNASITTLLNEPDNLEKIRDRIAIILKLEFLNQYQKAREELNKIAVKAVENGLLYIANVQEVPEKELVENLLNNHVENVINPADFNIGVYLERERPWQLTENSEGKSPFPLVNIKLAGYKKENEPGSTVNRQKYIGEFIIDCYAQGSPDNPDYFDDTDATLKAWKLERKVRQVLMSGFYTYLGMRDIVRRREITEVGTGTPTDKTGNIDDSAVSVTICRIVFSVLFSEDSPQAASVELEGISFKAFAPGKEPGKNGEVLLDI